jgi:2,3-bisphosphoglycerate-independent phosphoglycerate mutase
MLYDFTETFGEIIKSDGGKIVLVVLDGLGGIPYREGRTELEAARTPNLDELAKESAKGMHIPVEIGITPGSGPSHLALFGYDPVKNIIKRGIMEALGIGITPSSDEIVARGNFAKCSEEDGKIKVLDRRAGRISTEINKNLCAILSEKIRKLDDVEVKFYPVKEHRVCVSLKGKGLSDEIGDTDPQKEGEYIRTPQILGDETYEKRRTAEIVERLTFKIFEVLKNSEYAQCILLRGFSKLPDIESFEKKWKLKALAIATYPMYKGIAKILGMDIAKLDEETVSSQIKALKENFERYDFFYFHFKKTDSRGEDGDFEGKVKAIEEFDSILPEILSLGPDVLAITGDHSSPSALAGHSFHPVPIMIWSKRAFKDGSGRFTERDCRYGSLGLIYATCVMPMLLAHAGRLEKFGA